MGMTIAEKIIAAAAGVESVKPGDIHTVELDRLMSNDGTTHLTVDMYNNKLKNPHIADTKKLVFMKLNLMPQNLRVVCISIKFKRDHLLKRRRCYCFVKILIEVILYYKVNVTNVI